MNNDTEQYIQDLIRTSVMEIVKTDSDLPRLIENGLLKSIDDMDDVKSLANTILVHKCDERCRIRIGPGNTEKDFMCRKRIHPVRGNSDPTKHSYVSIKTKYQKATLDVLKDIDLYKNGKFNHSYFDPKRHMPTCNYNAKCNMSPVIPDFFVATKSMQNAQALDHTNGLTKYVYKYMAKFDQSNYTLLLQDIHSGDFLIGKTHLHNTKVVRSKINEDKAFSKERFKKNPKGRESPHFEIRQMVMGDEEVFTNMNHINISTLPFELRPTNRIELNEKGKIENCTNEEDHPEDAYTNKSPVQVIRLSKNVPENRLMSLGQDITYKNHDGKAKKRSNIIIFIKTI